MVSTGHLCSRYDWVPSNGRMQDMRVVERLNGGIAMDWCQRLWMLTLLPPLLRTSIYKMSVQLKIFRTANAPTTPPDETETNVAQALIDLENNVPELKAELRPLQISAAREVDVRGGKKAIVIFVPVPQLKAFHKVQPRSGRMPFLVCTEKLKLCSG